MPIGKQLDDYEYNNEQNKISTAKNETAFLPEEPKYSLDEVILPAKVKEEVLDAADYAKYSQLVFEVWGLQKTHKYSKNLGINLYGPSGTGKTMTAHAIANHLHRKILTVNYAEIESKYVGETSKNICRIFETAKETHSILFFDEADAFLSRRVTNMAESRDVSVNQTRSVLLMCLNDYQDFVIFATNFISNFDPAFMRRIAVQIKFEMPDYECRKKLWQQSIPQEMPNDIDIESLAEKYEGVSGSDIHNAVKIAAFKAARRQDVIVRQSYVEEAVEAILASKRDNERKNITVSERKVPEEYAQFS